MAHLSSLTGTRAQISFATSIRDVWIEHVTHSFADAYPPDPDRAAQALDVMMRLVNSIPDAAWWIANRHNLGQAFGPAWKAEMERLLP
jgi:hypothetical protein